MSGSNSTFLTTSFKDDEQNTEVEVTSKGKFQIGHDSPPTLFTNSFDSSGVRHARKPLLDLLEVAEILGNFKDTGREPSSPLTPPSVEFHTASRASPRSSATTQPSDGCKGCTKSRSNFWNIVLGASTSCCETCGKGQDNADINGRLPVVRSRIEKKAVPKKVKKYVCEVCGARFSQRGGVNSHVRTVHLKEKRFQCEVEGCDRVFGHRGDATRHVRSFHEGLKPFICRTCGVGFARKSVLKRHRGNVHRETTT